MEIIIFQLLSCLYLYDSSIAVPVRFRKQNRYTGFQPGAFRAVPPVYRPLACGVDNRASIIYHLLAVALIYRAAGIPASGVQRVKNFDRLKGCNYDCGCSPCTGGKYSATLFSL